MPLSAFFAYLQRGYLLQYTPGPGLLSRERAFLDQDSFRPGLTLADAPWNDGPPEPQLGCLLQPAAHLPHPAQFPG